MAYQFIALDVDGTLLRDDHHLSDRNLQTVREAHEAGGRIVLCTGRGPSSALPVLKELGLEGTMITHNGAATFSYSEAEGLKLLHQFPFPIGNLREVVKYCDEHHIHFDFCTAREMYIDRIGETEREMYERYFAEPIMIDSALEIGEPIVKFTLFGTVEAMDAAEAAWPDLTTGMKMIRSGDFFIDIMRPEVSKGEAVKQLAELWNIDRADIMAIGNYYNDLDMITFAGMGVAMLNSPEAVIEAADAVTRSNNDDGVHYALQQHFFGR